MDLYRLSQTVLKKSANALVWLARRHQVEVSPRRMVQYLVDHIDPTDLCRAQKDQYRTVHSHWYWAGKTGLYLLLLSMTMRMGAMALALHQMHHQPNKYQTNLTTMSRLYFPMLGSYWHQQTHHPSVIMNHWVLGFISLSPLYMMFIDWTLYHGMDHKRLSLIWNIVCGATRDNSDASVITAASRLVKEDRDRVRSFEGRLNTAVVTLATATLFIFTLPSLVYLCRTWPLLLPDSPLAQGQFLFDLTTSTLLMWAALRTALCLLYGLAMLCFVHHTLLAGLVRRLVSTANTGYLVSWMHLFQRYRRQWVSTLDLCDWLNRHGVGPVLMIVLGIGLPINIVMIVTLVVRGGDLTAGELTVMLTTIWAQTSLLVGLCSLCIWLCDSMYGGGGSGVKSVLFRLQPRMGSIRAKVAVMVTHESVCTRRKFHFTLGPCGKVSKRSMYEFLYIYSASLMFAFQRFQKEALVRSHHDSD